MYMIRKDTETRAFLLWFGLLISTLLPADLFAAGIDIPVQPQRRSVYVPSSTESGRGTHWLLYEQASDTDGYRLLIAYAPSGHTTKTLASVASTSPLKFSVDYSDAEKAIIVALARDVPNGITGKSEIDLYKFSISNNFELLDQKIPFASVNYNYSSMTAPSVVVTTDSTWVAAPDQSPDYSVRIWKLDSWSGFPMSPPPSAVVAGVSFAANALLVTGVDSTPLLLANKSTGSLGIFKAASNNQWSEFGANTVRSTYPSSFSAVGDPHTNKLHVLLGSSPQLSHITIDFSKVDPEERSFAVVQPLYGASAGVALSINPISSQLLASWFNYDYLIPSNNGVMYARLEGSTWKKVEQPAISSSSISGISSNAIAGPFTTLIFANATSVGSVTQLLAPEVSSTSTFSPSVNVESGCEQPTLEVCPGGECQDCSNTPCRETFYEDGTTSFRLGLDSKNCTLSANDGQVTNNTLSGTLPVRDLSVAVTQNTPTPTSTPTQTPTVTNTPEHTATATPVPTITPRPIRTIRVEIIKQEDGGPFGLDVSIQTKGLNALPVKGNGSYDFTGYEGSFYGISIIKKGYTFTVQKDGSPASGVINGEVTVKFKAEQERFTLRGIVTRRGNPFLGDVSIKASKKSARTIDGRFSFELGAGETYVVTPSLDGYSFTPAQLSIKLDSDTNIEFAIQQRQVLGDNVAVASIATDGERGNGPSGSVTASTISADSTGRFVAFSSLAASLLPVNPAQLSRQVFLRDMEKSITTCISANGAGTPGNAGSGEPVDEGRAMSLSPSGAYIAYHSDASNLVADDDNSQTDVYLYSAAVRTNTRISRGMGGGAANGASTSPWVTDDAKVAFASTASNLVPGDTNGKSDIFRWDGSAITRISVKADGGEAEGSSRFPSLDRTGSIVVFESDADLTGAGTAGKTQVYLRDLTSGMVLLVSKSSTSGAGDDNSNHPVVSGDGGYIAFVSKASNLAGAELKSDWSQVYLATYDRAKSEIGSIERISVSSSGEVGNGDSGRYELSISSNAKFISFTSIASNLVAESLGRFQQVFVHDRETGRTGSVSRSPGGEPAKGNSGPAVVTSVAADGKDGKVAYTSMAENLATEAGGKNSDVFRAPIGELPEVYRPNAPIKKPPTVVVKRSGIRIVMRRFILRNSGKPASYLFDKSRFDLQVIKDEFDMTAANKAKDAIVYSVRVKDAVKSNEQRYRANRNRATVRSLNPGTYRVSYHVEHHVNGKKVSQTKESKTRGFKVLG